MGMLFGMAKSSLEMELQLEAVFVGGGEIATYAGGYRDTQNPVFKRKMTVDGILPRKKVGKHAPTRKHHDS
jgi:hypothetical protein